MQTSNMGSWGKLLDKFNVLIEGNPEPKKVEAKLLALKEDARLAIDLTPKQREGIVDRVNFYLNSEYGNSKTESNFGHGKVEKEKK